jgi:3-oxoacyl-[acyl-carrier protein] reductase
VDLSDRRALVTGASRGLGAAVARRLAEAGARVVVHYNKDEAGAEATADAVREAGSEPLVLRANLGRASAVGKLMSRIQRAWGGLDLVVNNAGIAPARPWNAVTTREWNATLAVNLSGPFHVLRLALPMLQQSEGAAVVNLGSVVSFNGGAFGPAYAASKAGLIGLTRSAARELGPLGIRVNCVAPGPIDSPLAHALPAEALQAMRAQTPLRRLGEFGEVAEVVVWLLSPAAGYVTGQTLVVDGGRVMN